jgi:hypothetical protein
LLPGNPAKLVEPPAVHRQRRPEITPDIARTLLAAAQAMIWSKQSAAVGKLPGDTSHTSA